MDSTTRIAIENAITLEREAYKLYSNMNRQTTLKNEQQMLTDLAIQELKHERLLKEILNCEDFDLAKKKIDSEHPITSRIIDEFDPNETIAYIDETFDFAIEQEKKALNIYLDLLEKSDSEELKKLFKFLIKEETTHKLILEKERANI